MSNVKLAIRVRPLTDKEIKSDKGRIAVVNVVDKHTVTITNVKVSVLGAGDSRERVRRYHADFTYDSSCTPTHSAFASQEVIFDTLGRQVLSTILLGQSACILTYGQSATGKTHTMMGSTGQLGLVPRICKAMSDELFDITISCIEIYNERVHDLLAGESKSSVNSLPCKKGSAHKDLRVREHPTTGPYVQNLRKVTVNDVETLLTIVQEGTRKRRTAATKRNSTSSRSHALIELTTPRATLHLVDLAGSEKAGWEGAGGRHKEGANINKSLVALSNVISALVNGGLSRRFVPYRDSALTWLLKDCFTGGGSIFIIATVSPSVACYAESASTLRWASRARRLPDTRTIALPTKTRAALQTQIDTILAELAKHYIQYKPDTGKLLYDEKHWLLHVNKETYNSLSKATKIGNIMNFSPNNDSRHSESTPSSVASGSSEIINNADKKADISNEINKEIDKLFGPALERAKSGTDMEVDASLQKHKKWHFRSQEILSHDESIKDDQRLSDACMNELNNEKRIRDIKTPHVSILYDNQRAEIIASVTERLYSKLKNPSKSELDRQPDRNTQNDVKITQPLNELKICYNARQRLMDINKKALRNKRKIGIPAYTQTRKNIIRVKDRAIDAQTDLQPYAIHEMYFHKLQRDVGTETVLTTPRLKEIAVGPNYGNILFVDKATLTALNKVSYDNTSTMTNIVSTNNASTQTDILLPPRRKKRLSAYSKYLKKIERTKSSTDESTSNVASIININITPTYGADSDSQSSDEIVHCEEKLNVETTPDLLTSHNNISKQLSVKEDSNAKVESLLDCSEDVFNPMNVLEDVSDVDLDLPRLSADSMRYVGSEDYENFLFGNNKELYPHNLKVSPFKERDDIKKEISFNDINTASDESTVKHRKIRTNVKEKTVYNVRSDDSSDFNIGQDFYWKCMLSKNEDIYRNECPTRWDCKDDLRNKELDSHSDYENICMARSEINERGYNFNRIEKNIESACSKLEASVNKYDSYLVSRKQRMFKSGTSTPTKYLQHLIKLRQEAVKLEYPE